MIQRFLFESRFKQKYDFCFMASPSSLTDKLHNQTVNFISFPSGCHGASFQQCLLFTNHLGLYKYFPPRCDAAHRERWISNVAGAASQRQQVLHKGVTV